MPSYASLLTSGDRIWDFLSEIIFGGTVLIGDIFNSDVARIVTFYAIYGIGVYFLMRIKEHERFVSFFAAFAAVFSTTIIIWVMIGHNTKPVVFSMVPWVFIFMEQLREKFSLLFAILLIIVVHLMMEAGHIQMIFYSALAFGIYLIMELISRWISKREPLSVAKVMGIMVVAGAMAFVLSSDRYLATLEYTDYSTRGSAPIVQSADDKRTEEGGNTYEYATMWSFSPGEMMTFLVPNYFGFGQMHYEGPLTGGHEQKIPTYWGQKPFEDAAAYMGIFVLGLAIIGAIRRRRDVFVQALIVVSLFALLLSFGSNFSVLYDLFYYNFPSFNKFRAPSMVLALMQFAVPVLAGYGLTEIIGWRKGMDAGAKKMLWGILIGSGAFLLLGFLFSALFRESYISAVLASPSFRLPQEMAAWVYDKMIADWYITGLIAVAAAVIIYLFVKNKLSQTAFFAMLGLLLVFDLWRVGFRPMDVPEASIEQQVFQRTDMIDFLKNDKSVYRIADFYFQNSNAPAYFLLQTVNGYHSAKLRVYQDLLDVTADGSTSVVQNPFLWNMMNVKYILTRQPLEGMEPAFVSQQAGGYVYTNPGMLPRAFFVDEYRTAEGIDILNHIKNEDFDPRRTAFLEEDIGAIEPAQPGARAEIIKYENHYVKIEATATGKNLLYIGDVFYPVSWRAYIDGKEVPIHKTNYAFRSVVVPEGTHKIELKYKSEAFETGRAMSFAANIVIILSLIWGIFLHRRRVKVLEEIRKNKPE
ncbi:MAG: YfhO family protein [Candidatus Kapaibacterium sp.]